MFLHRISGGRDMVASSGDHNCRETVKKKQAVFISTITKLRLIPRNCWSILEDDAGELRDG